MEKEQEPTVDKETFLDYRLLKLIKNIVILFPFITVYLIVCDIIKLNILYKQFHIPIFDFISFGELITRMLYDVVSYSVAAFICLGLFPWINYIKSKSKSKRLIRNFFIFGFLWSVIVLTISLFLLDIKSNTLFILCPLIALAILMFVIGFFKLGEKFHSTMSIVLIAAFLGMLIASIVVTLSDVRDFKSKKEFHTTEVKFNDGYEIKPLQNEYVVGMTENYLFSYNDSTKKATIYQRSAISTMEPGILPQSHTMAMPK